MRGVSAVGHLVSVAVTVLVSVSGEYCHSWMDSRAQWRDGFHCPEQMDKRDAVLCCGHCGLRYCCGDMRARLDQGACTDHSRGQETHSSEHTADLPVYAPFLIVICVFVVFVLLGSVVAVCLSQKPLPPTRSSQSPAQDTLHSPSEAPETLPMTASTGTSCGSSSSLCPIKSAPQGQSGHPPARLESQQQQALPPCFPQTPNPAFHRTMTLPTMLHPLMFPNNMLNSYMIPMQGLRPYRSVPSPCPPNTGTSLIQRSSDVIV
ncbi:protein shisa-2-like [Salminus brasiliensis]|uniref:protein shisa-2-like n=1 Tax=Salminus brasiliensis TaxID=930266 RepID=UPI003B83786E